MLWHYWFLNHAIKLQHSICNDCHMLTVLNVNISDTAIITLKDVDYSCIIHDISKSEAINLLNFCTWWSWVYIKNIIRLLAWRSKFKKSKALTKKIREELMPVACHLKKFCLSGDEKKEKESFFTEKYFQCASLVCNIWISRYFGTQRLD